MLEIRSKKILLVESNQRVVNILKTSLRTEFQAELEVFECAEAACAHLDEASLYDLIIVRNEYNDIESHVAIKVLNKIYDLKLHMPVIVLGEIDFSGVPFETLPDKFRIEELNRLIIKLLHITKQEQGELKLPDFVPIPISNFYLMDNTVCDIYIQLVTTNGIRFIRRLTSGDLIDKDIVGKYENMGLKNLYVSKVDHSVMMKDFLNQSLIKILSVTENSEDIHAVHSDSYEIEKSLLNVVGVTEHTVRLANATIGSMVKSIESNKSLASLLQKVLANKGSYGYQHSYLISALSYEVLPYLDWGKGALHFQQFEKMSFVAFFHDAFITKDDYCKISSDAEVRSLHRDDRDEIMSHANMAATALQKYPKTPPGVDVIIKQHHGMTNGIGFSESFSTSLSPMAIVFIVLEYYVSIVLELDYTKVTHAKVQVIIFDKMYEHFPLPSYRKIVDVLKKVCKNF